MMSESPRYGNQASQRVLNLLLMFAGPESSRGISELSRATGMNKNLIYRVLSTLVDAGYVIKDPGGDRYQLGYRILDLHTDEATFDLRALCRPTLEQLHIVSGESVFLSIMVGPNRVNIDWIEAQGRRVSLGQRGRPVPLHCTKQSRYLLSSLSDEEIRKYIDIASPLDRYNDLYPDDAVATESDLWDDLRRLRGAAHIVWRNPKQFSGAYVAFPLPGADEHIHGILTIGGPMERFDPTKAGLMEAIGPLVEKLQGQCRSFVPDPVIIPT